MSQVMKGYLHSSIDRSRCSTVRVFDLSTREKESGTSTVSCSYAHPYPQDENGRGNQTDQLHGPSDVIFDKNKNALIICDHENSRVMRWFYQNGTKQQILISDIRCFGLSIDKNGFIYVSDHKKNEVRRWKEGDESGIIVAGGNDLGSSLKQLYHPTGVIVNQLGQIYVADSENHRVMRWCEGNEEGEIVVDGNGTGNQSNQLDRSIGLSFHSEGNLYVADTYNYRIQKYLIDI